MQTMSISPHPAGDSYAPRPLPLTPPERQLRWVLIAFGVLSVAFIVSYLALGLSGTSDYPFTVNSTAKDGVFALFCLLGAADVRRFSVAVVLLIAGHLFLVFALAVMVISGHDTTTAHSLGGPPLGLSPQTFALGWMAADVVVAAGFTWLYARAQKARFGLRYLGSAAFGALAAMADVLVDTASPDRPSGEEVAKRVDAFLVSFESPAKSSLRLSLLALAYYPLLSLHPPLAMMDPASRLAFVRKRFVVEVAERGRLDPLRSLRQDLIFGASQLAYLGYYGDPRAAAATGYVPFSQLQPALAGGTHPGPGPRCLDPAELDGRAEADVVIIGSGAAGATMAYELAARGRDVLVLERGRHVDATQFTEDEATQYGALYADGALELSTDFRFAVTQGSCVGGSTVVNNGVCFDIPEPVLARWVNGLDSGLDPDRLRDSFAALRAWLPVIDQAATHGDGGARSLNPGGQKFIDGIRRARAHPTAERLLGGGRQHRGLHRLRLLQHRLPVRQEAVDAGQDAAPGPARVSRPGADPARVRGADGRDRRPARAGGAGHAAGWAGASHRRRDGRAQRRGDRLEPGARALGRRRPDGRQAPGVQPRQPDDRRVRGRRAFRARAADVALPHAARVGGVRARDVVQPRGVPVAGHARLARAAHPQHEPLRPHDLRRLAGRQPQQRHRRAARPVHSRAVAALHARAR